MGRDTAEFLRIMNERNAAIAARQSPTPEPSEDPIRLERERERREKYGQLRAREHPGKQRKGKGARSVFGHTDLT